MKREPTHDEHMETLRSYLMRGGPLWRGPDPDGSIQRLHAAHECRLTCEARCGVPMDPVLTAEGWTMHPACEFPTARPAWRVAA